MSRPSKKKIDDLLSEFSDSIVFITIERGSFYFVMQEEKSWTFKTISQYELDRLEEEGVVKYNTTKEGVSFLEHVCGITNDLMIVLHVLNRMQVNVHNRKYNKQILTNALFKHVRISNANIIELLIERGAQTRDKNGRSLICEIVPHVSDMNVFDYLVVGEKLKVDERGPNQKTPLLIACEYARKDVFGHLLLLGADVNDVDADGNGCLHHLFSCKNHNRSTKKHLLDLMMMTKYFLKNDKSLLEKKNNNLLTPLDLLVRNSSLIGRYTIILYTLYNEGYISDWNCLFIETTPEGALKDIPLFYLRYYVRMIENILARFNPEEHKSMPTLNVPCFGDLLKKKTSLAELMSVFYVFLYGDEKDDDVYDLPYVGILKKKQTKGYDNKLIDDCLKQIQEKLSLYSKYCVAQRLVDLGNEYEPEAESKKIKI